MFSSPFEKNLLAHPEECSENACDLGDIGKYISLFTMGVYERTKFEE